MGRRGGVSTETMKPGEDDMTHLSSHALRADPLPLLPLPRAERTFKS
jgi:hypothetical protein